MDLARIVGTIIATQKHESLRGCHICVLQPLDHNYKPKGKTLIAIDPTAMASREDIVYYVGSGDAVFLEKGNPRPVDASIVGILDWVHVDEKHIENVPSLKNFKKYE